MPGGNDRVRESLQATLGRLWRQIAESSQVGQISFVGTREQGTIKLKCVKMILNQVQLGCLMFLARTDRDRDLDNESNFSM